MDLPLFLSGGCSSRTKGSGLRRVAALVAVALSLTLPLSGQPVEVAADLASSSTNTPRERGFFYFRDSQPDVPWSIHVVKVARGHADLGLTTTLGKGSVIGMSVVSQQIQMMPSGSGRPLAAVNGDFWERGGGYPGRPRDLQIRQGELITEPSGHAVMWFDQAGNPCMTNIQSRFRVVWPDGSSLPIRLNKDRRDDEVVLYTSVIGKSTRTRPGGTELILEGTTNGLWLPLRIGRTYPARVRAVNDQGNSSVDRDTMVLSIGRKLKSKVPQIESGVTQIQLVTESEPNLEGTEVAIGGGPTLVRDGKAMEWNSLLQIRHPRAAVGWNDEYIYLVEVDGRQSRLSVGMTLRELAEYMVKLGCKEAMNLDGGGSATLWVLGTVVNSPSEGQERPAANALVVIRREDDN